MWIQFIEWLGGAYAGLRAAQDAGIWMLQQDMPLINKYAEAFIESKAKH